MAERSPIAESGCNEPKDHASAISFGRGGV